MSTMPRSLLGQDTSDPRYWGQLQGTPVNPLERGLGDMIWRAATQLGYTGSDAASGGDLASLAAGLGLDQNALADRQAGVAGPWVKDGDTTKRDNQLSVKLSEELRDKQVIDWLASQGYSLNAVDTGREWIQQLRDAQGNPVVVDAYNYANTNKGVNQLGLGGLLAVGGAAALGGLGAAGAAGAGTGAATTGAGAAGTGAAGLGTASLPANITAGLGLSNTAPLALAPSIMGPGAATAASAAAAAAGAGGAAGLTGNALADAALQASIDAGSFAGAGGGLGQAGIGGFGSGLANIGALDGAAMLTGGGNLLTTPGLGGAGAATSGLGSIKDVFESVKNSGVGQAVGTVADMVGGGGNLAAIIGGLAGATQGGKDDTATSQTRIDPRMAQYLYGSGVGDPNSLLGASQQWFQNNRSGMDDDMRAGLLSLRNLYTSPEYTQGYQQMRSAGQGLLGAGVAQNPFTSGQAPQFGRAAPQIQSAPQSPFLAGLLGAAPQMPNRFGG